VYLAVLRVFGWVALPAAPMRVGAGYSVTLCDLGVFVEEAAEPISPDHVDLGIDGMG
jgi:hypothetical protein